MPTFNTCNASPSRCSTLSSLPTSPLAPRESETPCPLITSPLPSLKSPSIIISESSTRPFISEKRKTIFQIRAGNSNKRTIEKRVDRKWRMVRENLFRATDDKFDCWLTKRDNLSDPSFEHEVSFFSSDCKDAKLGSQL